MKNLMTAAAVAMAFTAAPAFANTQVIDFESFSAGDQIEGVNINGVVFSSGTNILEVDGSNTLPGGSPSNFVQSIPFSSDDPFRADLMMSGVSSVSVAVGDFGADEDELFLSAFDASDNLLASDAATLAEDEFLLLTLSVSSMTDIAYVVFGSAGEFNNSVYFDDFTTTSEAIPVPAAALLFAPFAAAFGLKRRAK